MMIQDVLPHLFFVQLEITEGTPDLGVTSYWTDAEGNVVFNPNTPEEKMKTSVTGMKNPKRKGEQTYTSKSHLYATGWFVSLRNILLQGP